MLTDMGTCHDVIIVGGGPAGSMAALVLARAGLDVLVVDKATFPRPKVCGDCLHPRTWSLWERHGLTERFAALPHAPIRHLQISSDFSRPVTLPIETSTPGERAVARDVLDEWLMNEAVRAGAAVRMACVPWELKSNNTLVTSQGIHQAKVLIGADGRNSWVAHQAGLARRRVRCPRIAWQATLPACHPQPVVHMSFFPEGYFGLAPINSHQLNFCMVLAPGAKITPQQVASRFFPEAGPLAWRSLSPITRPARPPARGRILLAGDAARVVEPYTGEGIALALATGELAAECIASAFQRGRMDQLAADYTMRHRQLYRSLSWQNALTRWLGSHPRTGQRAARVLRHFPALARWVAHPVFETKSKYPPAC